MGCVVVRPPSLINRDGMGKPRCHKRMAARHPRVENANGRRIQVRPNEPIPEVRHEIVLADAPWAEFKEGFYRAYRTPHLRRRTGNARQ